MFEFIKNQIARIKFSIQSLVASTKSCVETIAAKPAAKLVNTVTVATGYMAVAAARYLFVLATLFAGVFAAVVVAAMVIAFWASALWALVPLAYFGWVGLKATFVELTKCYDKLVLELQIYMVELSCAWAGYKFETAVAAVVRQVEAEEVENVQLLSGEAEPLPTLTLGQPEVDLEPKPLSGRKLAKRRQFVRELRGGLAGLA